MLFDFTDVIDMFTNETAYLIKKTEGYHDYDNGGIWVEGKEDLIPVEGAIVRADKDTLELLGGGSSNREYWKFYSKETGIEKGNKIKFRDDIFTVMDNKDYSRFDANTQIYILKRGGVSER